MYPTVCSNCGEKSSSDLRDCPHCGAAKSEIVNRVSIRQSINDMLVDNLSFLDYPQLYVTLFSRLLIILFIIFVLPDFISNSEFFWMLMGIFSVYGLIKEVAKTHKRFIVVYKISKALLFAYFGAGVGNIISYAGRMFHFKFSYYFNLKFLYDQLSIGNLMVIIGACAGIGAMLIINKFKDEFEVKEFDNTNQKI